jgi:serine phosphatase RsbU (regulator of sigma subunit)/pSer/pThr/pTyr-binding forkhead associated (FHA) protein
MPEIAIQTAGGTRERYPLAKARVTVGRSRESDIFLPDQWLSRHHAAIEERGDGYWVADLNSKNGTLLNGEPVREWRRLRPGDVITLGEHTLTFCSEGEAEEDEADREPEGTRVFSVKELSAINTRPAVDPAELQRQNRVLAILSKAASELVVHRPLGELFDLVLELLLEAVAAERGAILILEGGLPHPVIKASRSRTGDPLVRVSRSIARRAIEERVSFLLPNVLEDVRFKSEDSILASGIRTAMCAPLWFTAAGEGRDQVIGLVYVDSLQQAHAFTEDDLRVLTALANVAAAKIENVRLLEESLEKRRLEEDMRMAAEIQTGLLPRDAPHLPGWDLAGCNRPCRTVGGDYYDFAIENGRLLLALGDVSGKGTGAALLMTVLRAAVRGHWTEPRLSEGVARINRTVCQNVPSSKYVTFFLASLDPATGRLDYVNAGHNPPLLVRAGGEVEKLTEGGLVLGMFDTYGYDGGTVEMRRGDTLVVYSDGVTETWDPGGEEFGEERLVALAVRERALGAEELQDAIIREIERFEEGARATDDRTLVVLKRA